MSRRDSRTGRLTWSVPVLLAVFSLLVTQGCAAEDDHWRDGEERGQFRAVYDGYGTVTGDDEWIELHPKSATNLDVTHGGLVVTRETFDDVDFDVVMTTEEQVRLDEPNPWEVAWTLWNYTDDDHFYAVALKPNGWEISKQDPAYPGSQRFIATGDERTFPVGEDHRVEIRQQWPRMTVVVDGEELATITDEERPYHGGSIGLYTEDATVRFHDIEIDDQH